MTPPVPEALQAGGEIVRRQTTWWDVRDGRGGNWRIRFQRKIELHFAESRFDGASVAMDHPLLAQYHEPSASLFISSSADDPEAVAGELSDLCRRHFDGWRSLPKYANPAIPPATLLRGGYGMLLQGPASFVDAAAAILRRAGVRFHEPIRGGRLSVSVALILGRSFVVARGFEFERFDAEHPPPEKRLLSTRDPDFLAKAREWLRSRGEVLVMIRRPNGGGARSFELFEDATALEARLAELPPRTSVTIFEEPQLPVRGAVDDDFVRRALATVSDGHEYLVAGLDVVTYGRGSWYPQASGRSHAELVEDLRDWDPGHRVAVGRYPTGPELHAYVPNEDGSIAPAAY